MKPTTHEYFFELYTPIHTQLSRFCRAIARNKGNAEDLINDTIVAAYSNIDKLKDSEAFKSYIFGIAVNLNMKQYARAKFKAEFNEAELTHLADKGANAEHITDFKIVYGKILELPEKMAQTLILFHISELKLEEIQAIQGGSLSGVKLRLKRGREQLLESLATREQKAIAMMLFTF